VAAIALHRLGHSSIRVVERTPAPDFFDANRSYTYCLTEAGKAVLHELGLNDIDEEGALVSGMIGVCVDRICGVVVVVAVGLLLSCLPACLPALL
jgi:2-polyprenyl-6-methoxyphenol hydroxylase-like FAD-dependent oxidoreductase